MRFIFNHQFNHVKYIDVFLKKILIWGDEEGGVIKEGE